MSIYKLYYHPICPFSRQVQVVLSECKIKFLKYKVNYWKEIDKISILNPAGEIPILMIDEFIIVEPVNIIEYLSYTNRLKIFDEDLKVNSEIKRLNSWCNTKLYREVIKIFIDEKIIKPQLVNSFPNTEIMRIARKNLTDHFNYFTTLLKRREWLANDNFTASDIVLSCHISVLDHLNEINWESHPLIKQFYSLVKSRPSFKAILEDSVLGITPPRHYLLLDF